MAANGTRDHESASTTTPIAVEEVPSQENEPASGPRPTSTVSTTPGWPLNIRRQVTPTMESGTAHGTRISVESVFLSRRFARWFNASAITSPAPTETVSEPNE